jgi:PGF-CTERM protein
VTNTIPTGFKIISGSKSASFDRIKRGDYRTIGYTLKATGSVKFMCDNATATYKDADGNSYSAVSDLVSIQVGGEVPVGADSDGDGWSDEIEKDMGTNPYSVDSDGDGLKDQDDPNPTVPEEKKKTQGFEAVIAIAGLLVVAYVLRRRG